MLSYRLSPMQALARLALPGLLAATCALAQVPAPTPAPAARSAEEDAIELSPFIVASEQEHGWSANSTLSATRTKMDLRDVPANIDAITSDFMEDLGLFTADDVTRFVANVYAAPNIENDNNENNFSFRGLSQRFNISRNYFRWYIPTDNYNVERIDFGKGSNSLIYGDVEPGGQGAVFTKRAQMRNFATLHGQWSTDDAYRAQIDVNRRLRPGLALRFNAVKREDRTFQDWSTYGFQAKHLALTWQVSRNTLIRMEAEIGEIDNARGYGGITVREQSARSRAFTTGGWWVTSDGTPFSQSTLPSADRSSSNGPAGNTVTLLDRDFFDVSMRNASGQIVGTKRVYGLPQNANIRGTFDKFGRPFDTYSITVEHRLGDLAFEFAYNHQNQQGERNDNYFSSTISLDVNGRPYIDSSGIDRKIFGNDVDAFRATVVYPWQPVRWMKQLFIASGEYREDFANNYRMLMYNVAGLEKGTSTSIHTTNDRIRLRAYLDDPRFYSKAFFDQFKPENLPQTPDFHPEYLAIFSTPAAEGTEWRQASAASLSASGRYFDGRLQSLVGVRWDWNKTAEYKGVHKNARGEDLPAQPKNEAAPGDYVYNPNLDLFHTSTMLGLTAALTRNINLYYVNSGSFRWQDARTFDNRVFGPITGTTREIGLKGDLLQDRLSFTVGVFKIDRQNVEYRWSPDNLSANEVEDLMNPNNLKPGDAGYQPSWHDLNQYRSVFATERSRGWDATLLFRPTRGFQARFTLAHTLVDTKPDFTTFRAFYDAAVSRGNESPALLADAKEILDRNDLAKQATGARAAPWSASWILDYSFSRTAWSPLRGVRVGVNGSWRDNYLLGILSDGETKVFGGQQHPINAYLMRDQKIWGQNVRFRVGVRNLIDLENSGPRKTGFTTLTDGSIMYRYMYLMPRAWDFTLTIKF